MAMYSLFFITLHPKKKLIGKHRKVFGYLHIYAKNSIFAT